MANLKLTTVDLRYATDYKVVSVEIKENRISGQVAIEGCKDTYNAEFNGREFSLKQEIDLQPVMHAKSNSTGKEYVIKLICFKTSTVVCEKKVFGFEDCTIVNQIA